MNTLGDDLPKVMAYVRDTVMPAYVEIGPAGAFALAFMRRDLDAAAQAMAEGDLAGMIAAYQALKEYKL
jgi:hypothetical protein